MRRLPRQAALLSAPLMVACSWGRFDDVGDDAPVVVIERPDELSGAFGSVMATVSGAEGVRLLVGSGAGRAAVFELGSGQSPTKDPISTRYCDGSNACALARAPAGLASVDLSGSHSLCFALGPGEVGSSRGIQLRCQDNFELVLPVPTDVETEVVTPLLANAGRARVVLASEPGGGQVLAGASVEPSFAWFYGSDPTQPVQLVPLAAPDPSFGSTLAVLRAAGGHVFAVGAPDEAHVWLFRSDDLSSFVPLGCVAGGAGFGRALVAGDVTGDGSDELVVSDADGVTVLADLGALVEVTDPACVTSANPAVLAELACGTSGKAKSCSGSSFGAALAVGDLDGDGDGEVVVGAPHMKVGDEARAGAVLLYDVEGTEQPADVLYVSSAEKNDAFGWTVTAPAGADRSIVAAGGPGASAIALFYCSNLVPSGRAGTRCR